MEDNYRRLYFEALDLVVHEIKDRFNQPGYKMYSQLLVKAAEKEQFEEEFKFVTDFYKQDFDPSQVNLQLSVMSSNVPSDLTKDVTSIIGYLRKLSPAQRALKGYLAHYVG